MNDEIVTDAFDDENEGSTNPTDEQKNPYEGLVDDDGVIRIKLQRKTIPVEADLDGSGEIKKFTIVQMTGAEKGDYEEYLSKQIIIKKGSIAGYKPGSVKEANIELIHRCLFSRYSTENKQRVSKHAISTWSAEAIDKLASICEKLNCVGSEAARKTREAEEEAKKD